MTFIEELNRKNSGAPMPPVNICDFEEAKTILTIRAVNAERWSLALKDFPHKNVCDLAMIFVLRYHDDDADYSITVTSSLAEKWGVSTEELYEAALENSAKAFPAVVETLGGMLYEISGNKDIPETPGSFVLTNRTKIDGFSAVLYPGISKKLFSVAGEHYILPSSRHEAIIVSTELGDPEELLAMVKEINSSVVDSDDFLADNVYWFDADGNLTAYVQKEVAE